MKPYKLCAMALIFTACGKQAPLEYPAAPADSTVYELSLIHI